MLKWTKIEESTRDVISGIIYKSSPIIQGTSLDMFWEREKHVIKLHISYFQLTS